MRFGNASTTVTGTATPASVNTRVMPHLRPTRPMAIFIPHTAVASIGYRIKLQTGQRFGFLTPKTLEFLASAPTRSDLEKRSAYYTRTANTVKRFEPIVAL